MTMQTMQTMISNTLDTLWIMVKQRKKKLDTTTIQEVTNESKNFVTDKHESSVNDTTSSNNNSNSTTIRTKHVFFLLFAFQIIALLLPSFINKNNKERNGKKLSTNWYHHTANEKLDISTLPIELVTMNVYNYNDFSNSYGIVPTFWKKAALKVSLLVHKNVTTTISSVKNNSITSEQQRKNASSINEIILTNNLTLKNEEEEHYYDTFGPCYRYKTIIKWNTIAHGNKSKPETIRYPVKSAKPTHANFRNNNFDDNNKNDNLHGLCRPGFLIIGAGKCGTS